MKNLRSIYRGCNQCTAESVVIPYSNSITFSSFLPKGGHHHCAPLLLYRTSRIPCIQKIHVNQGRVLPFIMLGVRRRYSGAINKTKKYSAGYFIFFFFWLKSFSLLWAYRFLSFKRRRRRCVGRYEWSRLWETQTANVIRPRNLLHSVGGTWSTAATSSPQISVHRATWLFESIRPA